MKPRNFNSFYHQGLFIHEVFDKVAEKYPDNIALAYNKTMLKYKEIQKLSDALSSYLINSLRIEIEEKICIYAPRSIELIIGMLAVFKSGAVYIPLDPELPEERLNYILKDCAASIVLTTKNLSKKLIKFSGEIVIIDNINNLNYSNPIDLNPRRKVYLSYSNLAYIIYTSGSTGQQKGVAISHGALSNRIAWQQHKYNLKLEDVVLHKTTISFDVSLWEMIWALTVGAKIVIAPSGIQKELDKLFNIIKLESITIIHFVPSVFKIFLEQFKTLEITKLKLIICSGEQLTGSICKLFFENNTSNKISLVNLYGPTEAAIDVTYFDVKEPKEVIPIGYPIWNTQIYILDESLTLTPYGKVGEIFIGGVGVAREYINKPDLTNKSFLYDPFKKDGSKMFKTGDSGYYLTDGSIGFIGRKDYQVKLRGLRIELGEIENALLRNKTISNTVVVCKGAEENKFLVAYYTRKREKKYKSRELTNNYFRNSLSKILPVYMIPSFFIELDTFPFLENGKVNRSKLQEQEIVISSSFPNYTNNPIEVEITTIWKDVLRLDSISRDDNFLDLGGHSILASKVILRINKKFDIILSVVDFFLNPTISYLTSVIEQNIKPSKNATTKNIKNYNSSDMLPLSDIQKGIWFMEQLLPKTVVYNYPIFLAFKGKISTQFLKKALDLLLIKHECLRVQIIIKDGVPYQKIDANLDKFRLKEINLIQESNKSITHRSQKYIETELITPFDLENDKSLSRGTLIHLSEEYYLLCLTFHHLIMDDWSCDVFLKELRSLYGLISKGEDYTAFLHPQYTYLDCVQEQGFWQEQQLINWKEHLGKIYPLKLSIMKTDSNSVIPIYVGNRYKSVISCRKLIKLSKENDTTLFVVLLAAFNWVLTQYSSNPNIVIGISVSIRKSETMENALGFFINTIAINTDFSNVITFADLLLKTKENVAFAQQNKEVPFTRVINAVNAIRYMNVNPSIQIMFNLWHEDEDYKNFYKDVKVKKIEAFNKTAKFNLEVNITVKNNEIHFSYDYSKRIFDEQNIQEIAQKYEEFLHNLNLETKLNKINKDFTKVNKVLGNV